MEAEGWQKDEKPYLIFTCSKCKQYLYVKTTQKTKKCLRCRRQHKVSSIINTGEIVKGMTKAVELVKTRQNQLAIKELGNSPRLRAADDFSIMRSVKKLEDFNETRRDKVDDNEYAAKFQEMMLEISGLYREFPYYVLEIMAENYAIPLSELKLLLRNSQKKGFLIRSGHNSYKVKS